MDALSLATDGIIAGSFVKDMRTLQMPIELSVNTPDKIDVIVTKLDKIVVKVRKALI